MVSCVYVPIDTIWLAALGKTDSEQLGETDSYDR